MTPFPTPYSTSICGFCVSSRLPPFSAFRRHSYIRFSNSPRNNTGVVFIPWFLPGWYTINTSRCFSEDAILRCVSVVTRCTSPLRMVLGFHALAYVSFVFRILAALAYQVCFFCISYIGFLQSWPYALAYVSFVFRVLACNTRGPTLALQSLTLSTWR